MQQNDESGNSLSLAFIEGLYQDFLNDPESVSPEWRDYFSAQNGAAGNGAPPAAGPSFKPFSLFNPPGAAPSADGAPFDRRDRSTVHHAAALQDRVDQLIRAYRVWGHMVAQVDPLGIPRPEMPELDPAHYGFTEQDLDRPFSANTILGPNVRTLRDILEAMRTTYCRSIGVNFMHISESRVKHWLQERMEDSRNRLRLSQEQQLRILSKLTDAIVFEEFIQKKYLGAKRFSLEGGETLIPLLQMAIDKSADQGVNGIVLAMAHRGRLNVLANIIGKAPADIFREFEDSGDGDDRGHRDVKYHLGYSTKWRAATGREIHLSLCFNPSHLEYVNTVALGRTRANQDRHSDSDRQRGTTILVHGDAAFAGEGIVQETLNLSELRGYTTGGTIHLIVNNQIGFTTNPADARSSIYSTDVARMLEIPIFHVNGEDPEAVAQVVNLALDFKSEFRRDVVIDMYCFRRRGHNEGDEPTFTQPLMYREIKRHESVREVYRDKLVALGGVGMEQAEELAKESRARLDSALDEARTEDAEVRLGALAEIWSSYIGGPEGELARVDTAIAADDLSRLIERLTELPAGFKAHPKIIKGLEQRRSMADGSTPIDWATAEALAFASLADQGYRIRMSGQDTERGTFSQRHAVLHDQETDELYMPLAHVSADQAPVEIYNSPLSEMGVMGFEYGYSLDYPDALVLWEAQFGDFANAAQVIIDQFIISAEEKWNYLSGLVLLLPHGFEGMGAEHSHARLERFLLLAAKDNIQIANLTTPAQYFHVLRRQVLRRWRKPLIIMTPKSLLRHPEVVSSIEDFTSRQFRRIMPDANGIEGEQASRILLVSGKLYYELAARREELERKNVAILRVEQVYPLPDEDVRQALAPYPRSTPVFWVQEEPENMGAWRHIRARFGEWIFDSYPLGGIARAEAASPATGSRKVHEAEQEELLVRAFQSF
jgi:2-oxoglutarate dehydrogenase E1 component